MKRELAIREREGKWRAKQEEALFQKRMVSEWKIRETDRRIGRHRLLSYFLTMVKSNPKKNI